MDNRKQVLSCVQPTGDLHLGNYLGAIKNYVKLQENYSCFYGVVDNHSMTMPYDPQKLRANTWKVAMQMVALGVDPENIFIQSLIPEHLELNWILGCVCSFGELSRMTQFKDKSDQVKSGNKDALISAGLFTYPVLQAADILIYHADYVPIGKDQEQHLELSRNIAARFNHQFKKEYFIHPEPLFTEVPKVLSLANPAKKMSKSLGEKHYINLFGDVERAKKQVMSAVTDTGEVSDEMSPGVKNLFTLLKALGDESNFTSLMNDYNEGNLKYKMLKEALAVRMEGLLLPIGERMSEIKADKKAFKYKILESSSKIRATAQQTLKEVRELTGLLNVKYPLI